MTLDIQVSNKYLQVLVV